MKTKICPQCKLEKPYSEFYKNRKTKSGLTCYCKICSNKNLLKYKDRKPLYSKRTYLKYRQKRLKQNREDTKQIRKRSFEIIANGGKIECVKSNKWGCCKNSSDIDFLSFDHIYGNGFRHRLKTGDGSSRRLYLWIIKNPEEARNQLQILCMNAQIKKTRLNREHRSATIEKPKWHDDNVGQQNPLGGEFSKITKPSKEHIRNLAKDVHKK